MTALREMHLITDTDRRGAQMFAMDLAEALHGDTARVLALTPGQHANPLPVPTLGARRLQASTLYQLRQRMAEVDVVIAHGSSTLAACAIAGVGISTPFVYRQISDQQFWAGTGFRRRRVQAYLSRAEHVVALWGGADETLQTHFGVARQKITVIPNGVPADRYLPPSEEMRRAGRREFGVPQDGLLLLAIGALAPEKGVDLTVAALEHLPYAHLLVVGDGPQAQALRSLAHRIAPGRVTFSPPVQNPATAYAAADVVVLPSRGGDSMPAVLIEAGLQAISTVATPIEGIVDIIRDGDTGVLIREASAAGVAAAVRRAGESRGLLGLAARRRCLDHFTIDPVATRWSEVLKSVTGKGQAPP